LDPTDVKKSVKVGGPEVPVEIGPLYNCGARTPKVTALAAIATIPRFSCSPAYDAGSEATDRFSARSRSCR